ncbi:hypothetical protein C5167_001298 [Papaver somniferum]|uniref:Pentacotripeptide-repeat region of PRORP domain-containing protein n=1 Tax=Papaver somniferum TaxID=3469 RepID=A0A4Y7KYV7_PAPSO|nr:hypothetical protein C5167_001298 [Papaver somniferum]
MTSIHSLLSNLSKIKEPQKLISPFHYRHFHSHQIGMFKYTTNIKSLVSGSNSAQTFANHLSNCTSVRELNHVYGQIIRTYMLELYPGTFQWNNIMGSYVRSEIPSAALKVYLVMLRSGVSPDNYTIPIVLKAACRLLDVVNWRQFHSVVIKNGLESNEFCESALISLYSKAGEFGIARKVFEQNVDRELGSWNAIIGALAQGGNAKEAIHMFIKLLKEGFAPDGVTMVSITSACGRLGNLELGLQLHKCVIQARTIEKSDILMSNSLVDMYGKCGRMDLAHKVFERVVCRNVSTWTSLITGYAMHGCVSEALDCFRDMRLDGVPPNSVTFIGVLSACVHGGLVSEGKNYFDMMKQTYGINPRIQHYGVMVDLLGRAGLIEEAKVLVERMPMKPNAAIWGALMGACEKYGNGRICGKEIRRIRTVERWRVGLWKEVARVREMMKKKRIEKIPGYSSV